VLSKVSFDTWRRSRRLFLKPWYDYIIIQLTPHWGFSVTDYIKYYTLTYVIYFIFTTVVITFSTGCVYPKPTLPTFPVEETRAPGENPRLSSKGWLTLFTCNESVARIEPTISEVKGACSDDCATVHERFH
jgi:hypothetical protein